MGSRLHLLSALVACCLPVSTTGAAEDTSCHAVCRHHPEKVQRLFAALDLSRDGLNKVRAAVAAKRWPQACEELLAYYRDSKTAAWLRVEPPKRRVPGRRGRALLKRADAVLDDTFTFQAVTARQPRRRDGGLNWARSGPRRDREWAFFLNRHGYFILLLHAWRISGDPKYASGFDALVRDWVASNPYTGKRDGSAQWRSLETGLRLRGPWPRVFYGFQAAEEFSPAARILMLSSIPDHADTCVRLHGGSNWFLMEMNGLANAAICWPEFKDSETWFDFALKGLVNASKRLSRDGVHHEMSANYHYVAAENFGAIVKLARRADRTLPAEYVRGVEKLWDYLALSQRPDGTVPLTGDSDRVSFRRNLKRAAAEYDRSDWLYQATLGKEGEKPKGSPSRVWPYSGQMVMRSGWGRDAHWSYFDAGRCGGWHGHYDNLHLSISAFGRDLLVDGGRYWYKGGRWREYFKNSASHNVILVDGSGQRDAGRGTSLNKCHRIHPEFDYVRGDFTRGFYKAEAARHSRAIVYLRGRYWLVFDRVLLDQARRLSALWHFHPDCTVKTTGLETFSTDPGTGNLRIVPVGGPKWKLEIVRGQEKPGIQGWYSPTYNVKRPNATAVYSAGTETDSTFAWALIPAQGEVPRVKVESLPTPEGALRVQVIPPGTQPVEVAVRFEGKAPVPLSGGLKLEGDCAVVGPGVGTLVVGGRVIDETGHIVAEAEYGE
jgi:hypothetical protein